MAGVLTSELSGVCSGKWQAATWPGPNERHIGIRLGDKLYVVPLRLK